MKLIELLEYISYDNMVNKLQKIHTLWQRGATLGERNAAKTAFTRIVDVIKREYGVDQANKAKTTVMGSSKSGNQSTRSTKSNQSRRSSQYQEIHKHIYKDLNTGWIFTVLRFTDPTAGVRGSDKVWGIVERSGEYKAFWGKYGGPLAKPKILSSQVEAHKQYNKKLNKGYEPANVLDNINSYKFIFDQFN